MALWQMRCLPACYTTAPNVTRNEGVFPLTQCRIILISLSWRSVEWCIVQACTTVLSVRYLHHARYAILLLFITASDVKMPECRTMPVNVHTARTFSCHGMRPTLKKAWSYIVDDIHIQIWWQHPATNPKGTGGVEVRWQVQLIYNTW